MAHGCGVVRGGVVSWGLALALLSPGVALSQPPPDGPPPAPPAPTRATFLSTTSEQWDVVVDDQPTCSTPCSGPLFPLQFVVLRSQERNPVILDVGRLPPGDLVVTGKPLHHGMYAGGIVATTLGGMALATGITLTAVGLAKDRGGMTTAGVLSGAVGALAIPGGIYLTMNAVPTFTVRGARPYASGSTVGVGGTF